MHNERKRFNKKKYYKIMMVNIAQTSEDVWSCINAIADNNFTPDNISYTESVALRRLLDAADELKSMSNAIETILTNEYK